MKICFQAFALFSHIRSSKRKCPHGLSQSSSCRGAPELLHAQLSRVVAHAWSSYSFVARQVPKVKMRNSFCCTSRKQGQIGHLPPLSPNILSLRRFRYGCSAEAVKMQLLKQSAAN